MLAKLVGFPSVSDDSNLPLIHFVQDYLADLGVVSPLVPNTTGEKASLVAHIGPAVPGAVILSGHSDVVPVEGQPWSSDPFVMSERKGRLYGRGTCDMKGFIASYLSLVPEMLRADLKRPIQLAISYDEEIGCLGAPPMIDYMQENLPAATVAIIGEPTDMKVVNGQKGIAELYTYVTGTEMHSSMIHKAVPAVMYAARLVEWHRAQNTANASGPSQDPAYEPPWTSLHVGKIDGGTAHNITAGKCFFTTDIRTIPSESTTEWIARYRAFAAGIEAEMKAISPKAGIEIEIIAEVPGCNAEPDGEAEQLARLMTGDNAANVVSYATEAGQFQQAGLSAVICGPGSINQAHQADEYLEISQLKACDEMLRRLISHLSS